MKKTIIRTPKLPERVINGRPIFSQAILTEGKLLFVAGQTARGADGNLVGKGDMRAQIRQIYQNITAALEAAGATWDNVVRTTTFVTDLDEYVRSKAVEVRWEFMKGDPPTSTTVQVVRMAQPDAMIEIEAFAVL